MTRRQAHLPFMVGLTVAVATLVAALLCLMPEVSLAANSQKQQMQASLRQPSSSANTGRAFWQKDAPVFSNSVLHWTQLSYHHDLTSPDPANGRILVADIWLAVDANGTPTAYHARYSFENGAFHQEVFQTASSQVIILGQDYVHNAQINPDWCISQSGSSLESLSAKAPPFADISSLQQSGARQKIGTPSRPLLTSTPLKGVTPSRILSTEQSVDIWSMTIPGHVKNAYSNLQLEVGSSGRVQTMHLQYTEPHGEHPDESWVSYGPVEVYPRASVPANMYAMPQQLTGVCKG